MKTTIAFKNRENINEEELLDKKIQIKQLRNRLIMIESNINMNDKIRAYGKIAKDISIEKLDMQKKRLEKERNKILIKIRELNKEVYK